MKDTALAIAHLESAAQNVMRLPCPDTYLFDCPRCIASAQLAKALNCLTDAEEDEAA